MYGINYQPIVYSSVSNVFNNIIDKCLVKAGYT